MYAMTQTGNVSSKTRHFIKQSVCATEAKKVYVCCAPEKVVEIPVLTATTTTTTTTTEKSSNDPDWLKTLKAKTAACEPDLGDRIVGGWMAEYDEFPWLALIEYTKRKPIFFLIFYPL